MATNVENYCRKDYVAVPKSLKRVVKTGVYMVSSRQPVQEINNSCSGGPVCKRKAEKAFEETGLNEDPEHLKEDLTSFATPDLEIRICKAEQQHLLNRAEAYINNISPDPHCFILNNCSNNGTASCLQLSRRNDNAVSVDIKEDTKKRKCYANIDCYVSPILTPDKGPCCHLPYGTKLLKPHKKLVELVAEVIYGSPDGFLQVKQIYSALQKKYPYFMFMHKSAINSWKSSIRHALFQKWFFKIKIYIGTNKSKRCYWGLNTATAPKEWTMPGFVERTSGIFAQADILTALTLVTHSHSKDMDLLSIFAISQDGTSIRGNKCNNTSDPLQSLDKYNPKFVNQSPTRPSKSVQCPPAPTKVLKHHIPQKSLAEKEYDPVLSSVKPIKTKKRLIMPQKGEKENFLQETTSVSPLKYFEVTDNMACKTSFTSSSFQSDENQIFNSQNYMDISATFNESCGFLFEEA